MAKIQQSVNRFVGDEDPKVRLCEEFILKALSPAQAQWIRRNKGRNSVVDAAEDYILPTISAKGSSYRENVRLHNVVDSRKRYNCDRIGHIAKNCRPPKRRIKDKKPNAATYFVKPSYGERLISVCGQVNEREILFDRAASTLWNNLPSSIRHEQSMGIFKKQLKTYLFRLAYLDFI
jgi:hypothetical protein